MRFLASLLGSFGEYIAKFTSGACVFTAFDEEEMPEELL